ncbi:hypothetical protein Lser_V15G32647 [Lactuca serriola]
MVAMVAYFMRLPCPRVKTSLGLVKLSEKFQTTQ